jgi:hypothetical protein
MVTAVMGQEYYDEAIKNGYREVTAEEWDTFQLETRRLKSLNKVKKNAQPGE